MIERCFSFVRARILIFTELRLYPKGCILNTVRDVQVQLESLHIHHTERDPAADESSDPIVVVGGDMYRLIAKEL